MMCEQLFTHQNEPEEPVWACLPVYVSSGGCWFGEDDINGLK